MMQDPMKRGEMPQKAMSLDELEKAAQAQLEDIKLRYCDVHAVTQYIEALKHRYDTEWARNQYLQGYSEALFTKIVTLETK